jgi:hypothetical protein
MHLSRIVFTKLYVCTICSVFTVADMGHSAAWKCDCVALLHGSASFLRGN